MSYLLRLLLFTVVWIFGIVHVEGLCYPDEDLEECLKRQTESEESVETTSVSSEGDFEDLFSVRGIRAHLQSCRVSGSSRYRGTCQYRSDCTKRSYGYSSTCGLGGLVCCKGRPVSGRKYTTTKLPTQTARPSRAPVRTTQRPSSVDAFKNEQCGVPGPSTTIFGGVKALEGELPFMVSFVTRWGTSFCGGVLITRKHVLTAAHCFDNRSWRNGEVDVRIGQTDITEREEWGTTAYVRNVKVHEKYEKKGQFPSRRVTPFHDIAIITLSRQITSRAVFPVCLPNGSKNTGQALIAGWGQTKQTRFAPSVSELRKAGVDTFSAETCQAKYTEFVKNAEIVQINQDMLCAGNEHADTCAGDSGGPLLYNERWTAYRWTVYGVVSFGPKICANPDLPGVYTKVDRYLDWIDANTKF